MTHAAHKRGAVKAALAKGVRLFRYLSRQHAYLAMTARAMDGAAG